MTNVVDDVLIDPVEGGSCNDYDYACGDPVNGLDLHGLRSLRQNIEFRASIALYCGLTRAAFKCQDAGAYGETATLVAKNLAAGSDLSERQLDAFRHIYWHAMMVADGFGFEWTQGLGRAYERYSNNRDGPGDLINNRHGAEIGQMFRDGSLQGDPAAYIEDFIRNGHTNTTTNCRNCKG